MGRILLILLLLISSIKADPSLREEDISKIMQEIFSQHVNKKEMTGPIFKAAIRTYVEQFDPDKIYFLDQEVSPYLAMSDYGLQMQVSKYEKRDYSTFKNLNTLIQNAILRARQNREPAHLKEVLDNLLKEGYKPGDFSNYASNASALIRKQDDDFKEFAARFIHRYGKAAAQLRPQEIITKYIDEMKMRENPYLYLNAEGKEISMEERENLFSLHVLKALASSLDSHTRIYNPKEAYDMKVRLEKGFKGVGVILEESDNGIRIASIIENSPAAKSGILKVGDTLIDVNGKNVQNMDFDEVMNFIRNQNGNELFLTILRDNAYMVKVGLKKDSIILDDSRIKVSSEKYGNGIIGVIKLDSFYQGDKGLSAEKDVRSAIEELDKQNLRGLILDLRDNNGGFLTQAVRIGGLFITNGVIVISKYSSGEEKFYRDMDGKQSYKGPLLILVSRETASAAEIVAQALQDYGVALVVGDDHTYGKGTIQSQTVTDKQNSTSYFKVTVGKYYTVSGKTPQVKGVISDIVIPGPLESQQIGEEYLEYSLSQDMIPSAYTDKLSDVDPNLKDWYLKYYTPTIQTKEREWRAFLPNLKKNSTYRLEHNKTYQSLLKEERGEASDPVPDNVNLSDLQLDEAKNVLKDMIYFESKSKRNVTEK